MLTIEQARANIESAKQAVVKAVEAGWTAERLAKAVNEVAEAEGVLTIVTLAENLAKIGKTKDEITIAVFEQVTSPSDDTWSGRANDVRRAKADGMKTAAQAVRWM